MKKILIWLLTLIFAVSVAFMGIGCKEKAPAEEEAVVEEEVVEEEVAEEEVVEEVQLLFWDFGNYNVSPLEQALPENQWYINEAIARFENANPDIDVEFVEQPEDKITEMMTATGMAESGPDAVSMWGGAWVIDIKDILLPLNDYFSEEEMAQNQGWKYHMADGNYYGVPINGSVTVIYYNKSLFNQAGVDPNEYDGTLDGLVKLCEKIKGAGIVPLAMGVADGWGLSFLEGSLFSSELTDPEDVIKDMAAGKSNFADNPVLVAAFKAVQDLYSKGFFNDDVVTIKQEESLTRFANAQAAMLPSGNWELIALQENLGEDLGVLPMPSMSADSVNFGTCIGGLGSDALVVPTYSKHPEEAVSLIKFLRSFEEEKKRFEKTGALPSIKGDYSDIVISEALSEFAKFTNATMFLDNLVGGAVADNWFSLESVMLSNQMSVEKFLQEWDTVRDEALQAK